MGYMTNGASAKSACILKRLNHGLDLIQASGELVTTLTADPEFKAKPELSLTHPNAAC